MPRRTYPLELILRAHGPAELVNSDGDALWASDADEDFRDEFADEFLEEDDFPEILDFLYDADLINDEELGKFESDSWDCTVETLQSSVGESEPDDDAGDDDEADET